MASDNEILAAIGIATTNAQAQYQAAVTQANATVNAAVQSTTIRAQADIEIAQIEAGWQSARINIDANVADITGRAHVEAARLAAQAEVDAAKARAEADQAVATTQAQATTTAAETEAGARTAAAGIEAGAQEAAADAQAGATKEAAKTDADARRDVADKQYQGTVATAQAEVSAAGIQADAQRDVATITTSKQVQVATIEKDGRVQAAQVEGQFRVQVANAEGTWHIAVANIEAAASNYRADQELAGVNVHENAENARLNVKLGFAQAIFDQIKPLIQDIVDAGTATLFGTATGQGFNPARQAIPEPAKRTMGFQMPPSSSLTGSGVVGGPDRIGSYSRREVADAPPVVRMGDLDAPHDAGQGGGGSTLAQNVTVTVPYIATRGVFTPAQLQQQVNQAYARNDARTQTEIRKAQGDLAGRGFSSNSPILEALKVGYVTANLRASVEAASQIRLQAAQANVDAVFRAQNARSDQYLKQEDVLINAEQVNVQRQVGILNAVASLVGGVL